MATRSPRGPCATPWRCSSPATLIERPQCDSGELLILGYDVPKRRLWNSVGMLAPCDALLIRGPMQCDSGELLILGYEIPENPLPGNALLIEMPKCDSGELLILGYEVPERPLFDSVEGLVPGDTLLIERLQCDSGELLILGHEVTERQLCDSSCPATRS